MDDQPSPTPPSTAARPAAASLPSWPGTPVLPWRSRLRSMALLAMVLASASAQADPPGRVGRLADAEGSVRWFDTESGEWADALRNQPLTEGDRMVTGGGARAVVQVGSSTLRLGERTEVAFTRLDDDAWRVRLVAGRLALRVGTDAQAADVAVTTDDARLLPARTGHYRVDAFQGRVVAVVWSGSAMLEAGGQRRRIDEGDRLEARREPGRDTVRIDRVWGESDEFARWALRGAQDDPGDDGRSGDGDSRRYVSPEMTGWQDLDRHGHWTQHPEYGAF